MNFLALPSLPSTIAIWSGGGFMISLLKNIDWLRTRNIFYWGDFDEHGFLILNQMRSYYQHTISVMMNKETFELFKGEGTVAGKPVRSGLLSWLNKEEAEMFDFLRTHSLRLEQEKIRQGYADKFFQTLVSEK